MINGLLLPDKDSGSVITVSGMNLNSENVWDIREKVGIVFQNPDNQFVGATVGDDVAFGLENRGVPRDQMVQTVKRYYLMWECWIILMLNLPIYLVVKSKE